MGGTDETLFGDLRAARGYRVRSATASAAGRDQPAAPAAGAPAAAEVILGGLRWSERIRGGQTRLRVNRKLIEV
jgi:hypothetical protein